MSEDVTSLRVWYCSYSLGWIKAVEGQLKGEALKGCEVSVEVRAEPNSLKLRS